MPHSIGLGMIGSSELSDRLLKGILRDHVVDGSRIYIAEQDMDIYNNTNESNNS